MQKKLMIIFALLVVTIGGALMYVALVPTSREIDTTNNTPASTPSQQPQPTAQPGMYKEYSEDAVSAARGTVILFFHAVWCPQCRALEANIKANTIPEDVTILKVNYDKSQELRQKYNVTLQTTLVKIDANGNEVKKFIAYDEPTLEAIKKNLLQWRC